MTRPHGPSAWSSDASTPSWPAGPAHAFPSAWTDPLGPQLQHILQAIPDHTTWTLAFRLLCFPLCCLSVADTAQQEHPLGSMTSAGPGARVGGGVPGPASFRLSGELSLTPLRTVDLCCGQGVPPWPAVSGERQGPKRTKRTHWEPGPHPLRAVHLLIHGADGLAKVPAPRLGACEVAPWRRYRR